MPTKSPDLRYVVQVSLDRKLSNRDVAKALNMSPTTISKYRQLIAFNGIDAEKLKTLPLDSLEEMLQARYRGQSKSFFEPDWEQVSQRYDKPDMTVSELYLEYAEECGISQDILPMSVTTFGRRLALYRKQKNVSMRQEYSPGEVMFVDFSGKHLFVIDQESGARKSVEVFVASLGFSQIIYATAVTSQTIPHWIEANTRALEYFGGSPQRTVPDNLKAAVTKPRHGSEDAVLTRSYKSFGEHYDVVPMPARSGRPQDKALAEIGVRVVNLGIIAPLRDRHFYSLDELNTVIYDRIERINGKKPRRLNATRRSIFDDQEFSALKPLPLERHVYTEWRAAIRVPKDYHVPWDRNYYSVPHVYVGHTVSMSRSGGVMKIYLDSRCEPIAVHLVASGERQAVTDLNHMPNSHREYALSTPEALFAWAEFVDSSIVEYFHTIKNNTRISPSKATQQMVKIKKLAEKFGNQKLILACTYAKKFRIQSHDSLKSILEKELYNINKSNIVVFTSRNIHHENVRGPDAYKGSK